MAEFAQQWLSGLISFVLCTAGCAVFELFGATEKQTWLSRVHALIYWSLFIAGTTAVVIALQATIRYFGAEPLLSVDLTSWKAENWPALIASYLLLPFAPYLLFDCLYYWFHRLQHSVPLLWRFHAVHHSIEELNAANCYHHPTEALFRVPFILAPLALVINLKVPDVVVMTTALVAWGQFVHANTRLSFGPLTYVLADPRFHRVHHSVAREHRDKNFASFFPMLDVLFGTAYFPKRGETIKTGLTDKREPQTILQYLIALSPRK